MFFVTSRLRMLRKLNALFRPIQGSFLKPARRDIPLIFKNSLSGSLICDSLGGEGVDKVSSELCFAF